MVQFFHVPFAYWFWYGLIYLILLSWDDIKHRMNVDDRKNWFMMGVTLTIYTHLHRTFIYVLGVILTSIILYFFIHKFKLIGSADVNTITWLIIGFGIASPFLLGWYCAIFAFFSLIYMGMKKVLQIKDSTPFYPVILASFIVTGVIFHLY